MPRRCRAARTEPGTKSGSRLLRGSANRTGRKLRVLAVATWLLMCAAGCRLLAPDRGPIPTSLANCRQLSQQAYTCIQRDEWRRAETLLAQAIEHCPTSAEARRHHAETLWHREAFEQAVAQMETAVQLDSSDTEAAVRAGEMRLALGHVPRARVHAERALDLDSQMAKAWYLRGCVLRAEGKTDRALADFHRALDLAPDDREVLLAVAELYRLRNQPGRALTTLHRLVDVYPPGEEPGRVLYLQGLAYSALGRHEEAIDSYQMASGRGESTADLFCHLAEAHYRAGRPTAADQAVRQALACNPQHEPSRLFLRQLETARRPADALPLR